MQEDLISVIVPICDSEDHLERCVDSLINQTHENLEIILVVNSNKYTSAIICDSYANEDKRVKVIRTDSKTSAGAKNAGLDNATGDYVTFVNADNFVDKDYAYILLNNLKETHSDMSICAFSRFLETKADESEDQLEASLNSNVTDTELKQENLKTEDSIVINAEQDKNIADSNEEISLDIEPEKTEATKENIELDNTIEILDEDEELESEENDEYDIDPDFFVNEAEIKQDNEEEKTYNLNTKNIKLVDRKKARNRIVIVEGEDIFDYFFSSVEKIKTTPVGKLYRKNIFKKLRFEEDRIFEDEFIAHRIYLNCKKFVRSSLGLYYYNVQKAPLKTTLQFTLKDLDFYYALENRYNYFKETKWQPQALNQILTQIANLYCAAKAGKADNNTLKFLKHKFKLYYQTQKKHKLNYKMFRHFPNLYYEIKRQTTKKI